MMISLGRATFRTLVMTSRIVFFSLKTGITTESFMPTPVIITHPGHQPTGIAAQYTIGGDTSRCRSEPRGLRRITGPATNLWVGPKGRDWDWRTIERRRCGTFW